MWTPRWWSYTFSSSFQVDSRLVLLMCMFQYWQVDGKYRLGKKIASSILNRPWCGAILHSLIQPPPYFLAIQERCCECVCLCSKLVASTDSEKRLVLLSCTDPGAGQFYMVLYSLLHFACWFKTGVVNVYVYGLANWWQVQIRKEDWFWYLVQTLVRCNCG